MDARNPRSRRSSRSLETSLRGIAKLDALLLLRGYGANFCLPSTPDSILESLARRLHHMPAAMRAAVEYLAERSPILTMEKLLASPSFFQDFDRGDLESGFQSLIAGLLKILPERMLHVIQYFAILPEPVPEEALTTLAPDVELAEILAKLGNPVMLAVIETDVFGSRWFRSHTVVRHLMNKQSSGVLPADAE